MTDESPTSSGAAVAADALEAVQPPVLRRRAGFTFIELMMVVLVLAIAAAMAAPLFGRTEVTRLRSAATMLAADLDFAQIESITHSDDLRTVVIDQADNRYYIAATSDPTTPITNPVGGQPYSTQFGVGRAAELTGVSISAYALNGDAKIGFGPYGQLDQTAPATISLAAGDRTVIITLDPVTGNAAVGDVE